MLLKKEAMLEFERKKQHNTGFPTSNCPKVLKIFNEGPVKYYFLAISVYDY